jgi:hypothetical protein
MYCNLLKLSFYVVIASVFSSTSVVTIILLYMTDILSSTDTIPYIAVFLVIVFSACEIYSYWLIKKLDINNDHNQLNDSFVIYREHKKKCLSN